MIAPKKLKILIIDDSRVVHSFAKESLSKLAAEISDVFDGQAGVDRLVGENADYDLVLLDWEMPKMEGCEVLRRIRAAGLNIPVIMMTSRNSIEDISSMMAAGASEYVMKPFTPDILLEKVKTVLGIGEGSINVAA